MDLSFEYCWTAIYADIEVYMGIVAANLSLSRMYYGWFRDTLHRGRDVEETAAGSVDDGPHPLAVYSGTKSVHSVQIRGRRSQRESDTPSEGSQRPLGITREVQYSVTDAHHPSDHEDYESQSDGYRANRTPSLPKLDMG